MKKILSLVLLLGFSLALSSCAAPTPQPPDCPVLNCPEPNCPTPAPTATPAGSEEEMRQQAIANANSIEELRALFFQYMEASAHFSAYDAAIKMIEIDPQNSEGYIRASEATLTLSTQNYERMNQALASGMQNAADNDKIRQWIAENDPNLRMYQPEPLGPVNAFGNSNANIANGGLVAGQGDWVYFSHAADAGRLYKMRSDGTEMTRLSEDTVAGLNVIGEWVYYSCLNEEKALYKTRTDGSQRTRIGADAAQNILVAGDWIYYANNSDWLALYKIKTDGSQRTKLSGDGPFMFLSVDGEWIYFAEKRPEDRGYFRMRLDGSELARLPVEGNFSTIFVQEDVIYYISVDENILYRMRPDGSEKMPMHENFELYAFTLVEDWLYISFNLDGTDFLSRVKADRSDSSKLAAESARQIFGVGDGWIYFINDNAGGMLYKMREDGNDLQPVQ